MGSIPHKPFPGQSHAEYIEDLYMVNPRAFSILPLLPRGVYKNDEAYVEHMTELIKENSRWAKYGMIAMGGLLFVFLVVMFWILLWM